MLSSALLLSNYWLRTSKADARRCNLPLGPVFWLTEAINPRGRHELVHRCVSEQNASYLDTVVRKQMGLLVVARVLLKP